ncbi:hypothetical protein FUAX_01540 [Fulvitalea axinellae]|uniref:Carbohydrate-binding domain-containing protein n=1 Tax=Fulvitalea axinellae TaxID=1182444 RepID=A0AAU9CIP5_9BACT|nr:hypothetical protein FUAX_01540 [Fulvitalea axinellae]
MKSVRLIFVLAICVSVFGGAYAQLAVTPTPKTYVCNRAPGAVTIDGSISEKEWGKAPWTDAFVDIEGDKQPAPRFNTRTKMMWDDKYLYFAAKMEEPDLWATLTENESVIFQDNDFEIFLDPDGDSHNYYEFEINALGTTWDLILGKAYRDGGPALTHWDLPGMKSAVQLQGSLNDPSDRDKGWTVEIALPLAGFRELYRGKAPKVGDYWRMNLARVQWRLDAKNGKYAKKRDKRGKKLPENNWVWSPQHVISLHKPECWGYLLFSGSATGADAKKLAINPDEEIRLWLYAAYAKQREFQKRKGRFAKSFKELGVEDFTVNGKSLINPEITAGPFGYALTAVSPFTGKACGIRYDGKSWIGAEVKRKGS